MLLVLSLGLRAAAGDAVYVFRRPALLARSVLAMNVAMPLVALWLVLSLDLRPVVKIALVALSVSPVPPILPNKQLKLTGREGYVYGLLVTSAVLAVPLVPLTTAFLASWAQRGEGVGVSTILKIVVMTVLLPLAVGIGARRTWPGHAERVASIASKVGTVLLIAAFLPVLISQWPAIRSLIGDGTLLAIIAFTCIGLLVGHLFGGPDPPDRSVLALATASRHPAVALAVASTAFPDQKLAPAAVLLSLLVGTLATAPYSEWRRRSHGRELEATKESAVARGSRS